MAAIHIAYSGKKKNRKKMKGRKAKVEEMKIWRNELKP
jgi:hypothetical protein